MSHYSCMVIMSAHTARGSSIRDNLTKVLAPYSEHLEVTPYVENSVAELETERQELVAKLQELVAKGEEPQDYLVAAADTSVPLQAWAKEYYGRELFDDAGNMLTTYNPLSKWDWWELGGRFSHQLVTLQGKRVDTTTVSNLDLAATEAMEKTQALNSWKHIHAEKNSTLRDFLLIGEPDTQEAYVAKHGAFYTYAVIDRLGQWYARGEMLYFGVTKDEPGDEETWRANFKRHWLDTLREDDIIAIVDLHI